MPNLVWVDAAEKARRSKETAKRYARLMAQPPRPFGTALAASPYVSQPAGEQAMVMTNSGMAVASPSQSPPAAQAALQLQLLPHGTTSRIGSVASAARAAAAATITAVKAAAAAATAAAAAAASCAAAAKACCSCCCPIFPRLQTRLFSLQCARCVMMCDVWRVMMCDA